MSNLPYDAQIEYLEGTGTQYINTGFTNTKSTEFVMDFQLTDSTGDRKAIGQGFKFGLGQDANKWRVIDSQWYNTSIATDTLRHIAYTDNGKYYIDSTQIADRYSQKTAGTYPMLLFAVSSQNSVNPDGNCAKMKLYSCKIYDDGVLVRDFIPVRVGQVGYLYDKVTEELFGNAGTGSFTLGNDVVWSYGRNVVKGFRRRLMMVGSGENPLNEPIIFADPVIKASIVEYYGGVDGGTSNANHWINNTKISGIEGEITYRQAAAIINFDLAWRSNNNITSFDELQYFINATINNAVLFGCQNCESVTLPSTLTLIPYEFIRNGKKLTFINTENITTFSNNSFFGCSAITYIPMNNMLETSDGDSTSWWAATFRDCTSLDRIIMPKVTAIRNPSFFNDKPRYVVITASAVPRLVTSDAFNITTYNIYVRDALVNDYKVASEWSNLASRILPVSQFATDFPNETQETYDLINNTLV